MMPKTFDQWHHPCINLDASSFESKDSRFHHQHQKQRRIRNKYGSTEFENKLPRKTTSSSSSSKRQILKSNSSASTISYYSTSNYNYSTIKSSIYLKAICLLLLINCFRLISSQQQQNSNSQSVGPPRPPRIKEHPSSAVVKKHDPITLSCKADGEPEPVIEWYRDNELVKKSSNHIYMSGGDLFILKAMNYKKEKDTGIYFCLARNVHGKARSHNATIEIASIRDEFQTLPKNTFAAVGDVAILECTPPRGYPEPRVQWRKDDNLISLSGRYRLSGTNLHITDVQPEDTGRYQCIAQNKAGSRESPPAQLIVRVKPYFIVKPEDVTALSNKMTEIHCKVGGDPLPKVTWRREGGQISKRASITEDKSLRIYNVTEEDEGLYVCEAENSVDRISHSANLIVHSKPTFLVEPKDVKVNMNGIAKFDCVASGNPRPSVFWTKENHQFLMFPDNKYERFSVTPEGSLIISPVKREDKGYYVCSALSVVSSATVKAFLNITSQTDLPPPIIVLGPADQTLPEHTTGMLPCEATGVPQPQLKWFLNNNPIPLANSRFNVLDSGVLQIDDLQITDSGEYKCLAYSDAGEASWFSRLIVASPHSTNTMFHRMPDPATFPDSPGRPQILNVTENSVTISWTRPTNEGASPYKGAIVEYFSPDHHHEWIKAAKSLVTADRFTITGLKSGSRYYFLVRAKNNHGIGLPSPISYETRTLGRSNINRSNNRHFDLNDVRRRLENIVIELKEVRTISSSAVKLFWTVHGGQEFVEGFYIRYRSIDPKNLANEKQNQQLDNDKYDIVTVYNGGASTYIINNLPKYTTFEFFLVPFFKSIDGKPSNSRIVRTLEGVPSAPPSLIKARPISSSSALITWQPPPTDQSNGLLLGYILFVHGAYTPYNINLTVNSNTTSYLLRNLTSETEYIIQITAFTSVGVGVPSSPLTFIMDPLLSNDVYNERNVTGVFDTSNVWICVLIISLIILSLIVLLLGFLLYKKRTALHKKNNENLNLNRELKTQTDTFYHRNFEFTKSWQTDSRPQSDLKQVTSANFLSKMSPTLVPTDNNGYSTVTTDDQADYDYVSQHGENNYETTYDQYGPVAYASSSIISSNPYRHTGNQSNSNHNNSNNQQQQQQQYQWRTQFNLKNDNHMAPNFTATLDRNLIAGTAITSVTNPSNTSLHDTATSTRFNNRHRNLYQIDNNKNNINATEPLINNTIINNHHLLNDFSDNELNHYHYADSNAYQSSNVTQIPSSKLMANQVKYGSLSRIHHQQQQQQQQQKTNDTNFSKKSRMNMIANPLASPQATMYERQQQQQPPPLPSQSQQPMSNLVMLNSDLPPIPTNIYKSRNNHGIDSSSSKNIIDICDSESTYQELS